MVQKWSNFFQNDLIWFNQYVSWTAWNEVFDAEPVVVGAPCPWWSASAWWAERRRAACAFRRANDKCFCTASPGWMVGILVANAGQIRWNMLKHQKLLVKSDETAMKNYAKICWNIKMMQTKNNQETTQWVRLIASFFWHKKATFWDVMEHGTINGYVKLFMR